MANDFLQDSDGNKSSKRLWGSYMLGLGAIMGIILFGFSIWQDDDNTCLRLIDGYLISGSSLLGFGVIEKFGKKDVKTDGSIH